MIEIERSANILVMQRHNTTKKLDTPRVTHATYSEPRGWGKREGREYFIMSPHVVVDAFMIRGLSAVGRASSYAARRHAVAAAP